MLRHSELKEFLVTEEAAQNKVTTLPDWDTPAAGEYDSKNFRADSNKSRRRKSTSESIRNTFGAVDESEAAADEITEPEVRSVSDRIRRRSRTLTIFRSLFPF